MVHLRIVAPREKSQRVLDALERSVAVCNIVRLPDAARKPDGDMIICDVAREAASIVISDLTELGIPTDGSVSIAPVETQLSDAAERADRAAPGDPSNAVVWEEVEELTSEASVITASYMIFMALACMIAAVGIFQNSSILIVGSMILGPEFGPLAGLCVAIVGGRSHQAIRSALALGTGFPLGISAAFVASLLFKWTGVAPHDFDGADHFLSDLISHPNVFSVAVALAAGIAGMLSLTTSKSATLLGVLVSVTTIPAAANIGVSAAYGDGSTWVGSQLQLAINLTCLIAAGIATLFVQRWIFNRRLRAHRSELAAEGVRHD